jgi:APA family basic amino acid/polyamine antiporter
VGVLVMRKNNPDAVRPFRTPWVPVVPLLGIIICALMIVGLDTNTQLVALGWLLIGLVVYFAYSKNNSVLRKA